MSENEEIGHDERSATLAQSRRRQEQVKMRQGEHVGTGEDNGSVSETGIALFSLPASGRPRGTISECAEMQFHCRVSRVSPYYPCERPKDAK